MKFANLGMLLIVAAGLTACNQNESSSQQPTGFTLQAKQEKSSSLLSSMAKMRDLGIKQVPGLNYPIEKSEGLAALESIIKNENCEITIRRPNPKEELMSVGTRNPNWVTIPKYSVEIAGVRCPVKYSMRVTGEQKDNGFWAKLIVKFEGQTESFKSYSDLEKLDLEIMYSGGYDVNENNNVDFVVYGNGSGVSHSQGTFAVEIDTISSVRYVVSTGSVYSIHGELEDLVNLNFPTYAINLNGNKKFRGNRTPAMDLKVGAEKVDEQQFLALRTPFMMPWESRQHIWIPYTNK